MRWRVLLAAVTGAIAWSGPAVLIPLSIALPVLCHWPDASIRWRERVYIAFAYYAVALWPVTTAGVQLFGTAAIPFLFVVTVVVGAILAASWMLPSILLPLILTAIPPICIFGVAHPMTAAGMLFPGATWIGLLVTLFLPSALVRYPRSATAAATLISLALNISYRAPQIPTGWHGVNTSFGDIRDKKNRAAEFRAALSIQETALNSNARVLVFPELAVSRWTEATEAFWQPTLQSLAEQRRNVLIGAGIPIKGSQDYQNVLMSVPFPSAGETRYVSQRIPLPWAMWNPIATRDRVPLHLLGRGTIEVASERAAVVICYEQLLPWPILSFMAERPTLLVAVSDAVWTRGTPIPAVQAASVSAWSRLFNLPAVVSVNQ
jgi:hypothetical protein